MIAIRPATLADAPAIAAMLAQLSAHLGDGDAFASTPASIAAAGFGAKRMFHTQIAMCGDTPLGMALFFPHYSTLMARPGAYIQDLWVDPSARGHALGARLLAAAARQAATGWQAAYLKLSVHAANTPAAQFYAGVGFAAQPDERALTLRDAAFARLLAPAKGTAP